MVKFLFANKMLGICVSKLQKMCYILKTRGIISCDEIETDTALHLFWQRSDNNHTLSILQRKKTQL